MKKALFGLVASLWLAAAGCAVNPSVGKGITTAQKYFGDLGVEGHNQNVTILTGSRVTKLSIIGDNNTVTAEDGAAVYRVEFWGNGNTVIVPENLWILRTNNVGTNQVIRRPSGAPPVPPLEPLAETPKSGAPKASPGAAGTSAEPAEAGGEDSFLPEDK
jgi:hypothetical protein